MAVREIAVGEKKTYTAKIYQGELDDTVKSKVGCWWTTTKSTNYEGEVRLSAADATPAGAGTRWFADSARYDGMWVGGLRSRHGLSLDAAGQLYAGEWSGDSREGFGVTMQADGDFYAGEFRQDVPCGYGVMDRFESEGDPALREEGLWLQSGTEALGIPQLKPEKEKGGRFPNKDKSHEMHEHAKRAVHKAVEQAQLAMRAAMRAQDAQVNAVLQMDIEADDGRDNELRIRNAKSEAEAAAALVRSKANSKRKVAMDMADTHMKLQSLEDRIAFARSQDTKYDYWLELTHIAEDRVAELRAELRRLRRLEKLHKRGAL